MTPARTRLPDARPNVTIEIEHDGRPYAATIGLDSATGRILEIFAHGAKVGSGLDGICDDTCIALSLLLQLGMDPAALAASMGRLGDGRTPTSIIGRLADLLAESAATINGTAE